uniref:(northern house mosquito) hypothetical protein n=1 Tax=Culex pipiens TaxID=7175 RepID=A0A8D8F6Q3_CULPI
MVADCSRCTSTKSSPKWPKRFTLLTGRHVKLSRPVPSWRRSWPRKRRKRRKTCCGRWLNVPVKNVPEFVIRTRWLKLVPAEKAAQRRQSSASVKKSVPNVTVSEHAIVTWPAPPLTSDPNCNANASVTYPSKLHSECRPRATWPVKPSSTSVCSTLPRAWTRATAMTRRTTCTTNRGVKPERSVRTCIGPPRAPTMTRTGPTWTRSSARSASCRTRSLAVRIGRRRPLARDRCSSRRRRIRSVWTSS